MIELDGRSLMNRKKEAALLDMVENYNPITDIGPILVFSTKFW